MLTLIGPTKLQYLEWWYVSLRQLWQGKNTGYLLSETTKRLFLNLLNKHTNSWICVPVLRHNDFPCHINPNKRSSCQKVENRKLYAVSKKSGVQSWAFFCWMMWLFKKVHNQIQATCMMMCCLKLLQKYLPQDVALLYRFCTIVLLLCLTKLYVWMTEYEREWNSSQVGSSPHMVDVFLAFTDLEQSILLLRKVTCVVF